MSKKIKWVIFVSTLGLFIDGCATISDPKLEKDAENNATNKVVVDTRSPYRQNLKIFGEFRKYANFPNVPKTDLAQEGECDKSIYKILSSDGKSFFSENGNSKCFPSEKEQKTDDKHCKTKDGREKLQQTVITKKGNIETQTIYKCIDKDITPYKVKLYREFTDSRQISIGTITNKSGSDKIPLDISIFVRDSVNNISNKYKLIGRNKTKDVDEEEASDGDYRIEGAITTYDVTYDSSSSSSGNVYGGKGKGEFTGDLSNNNGIKVADIGLDLLVKKFSNGKWNYLTNVSTSKSIKLVNKSEGDSYAMSIMGLGFSFNDSLSKSTGVNGAMKAIVDFSVLELLAKIDDLPYWAFAKYNFEDEEWRESIEQKYDNDYSAHKLDTYVFLKSIFDNILYKALKDKDLKFKDISSVSRENTEEYIFDRMYLYSKTKGLHDPHGYIDGKLIVNVLEDAINKISAKN